jgi:hypothetical protein
MANPERHESKQIGSDRRMFSRAMVWAGIALLVMLMAALFIARPAAKKIQPVTPSNRSDVHALQIGRA